MTQEAGSDGAEVWVTSQKSRRLTLGLLGCGVVGPTLFTLSWAVNEALRPHFNLWQESITMLSRGPDGWIQDLTFALFGLMSIAFALGLRRVTPPPGGSLWLPRLQAAIGAGLLVAGLIVQHRLLLGPGGVRPMGVFTPYGYITVAGLTHVLAAVVIYVATVASCLLVGRSLRTQSRAGAAYSLTSGWLYALCIVGFAVTPLTGGPAGLFERLAGLIGAAWTVWFAARTMRALLKAEPTRGKAVVTEP